MPKYCMSCGISNDDQASYCTSCGKPFPGVVQVAQPPDSAVQGDASISPTTYTAEMTAGEHKHILNNVTIRDGSGAAVYIARRPSLLHENFEIEDAGGRVMGRVNRKVHLMGSSFELADAVGTLIGVVQIRGSHQQGRMPSCWLEDGGGNTLAVLEYESMTSFDLVKPDGSKILRAGLTHGGGSAVGGIGQTLRDLAAKRYTIELFDRSFTGLQLAGAFAALDIGLNP